MKDDGRAPTPVLEAEGNEVVVRIGDVSLGGELQLPGRTLGVVAFAHGSGSSRHSPRNQYVARFLRQRGLGTFLFDLLTPEEEREDFRSARLRFDIDLLAERLIRASGWLSGEIPAGMPVGYFGASTGARPRSSRPPIWDPKSGPSSRGGAAGSRGRRAPARDGADAASRRRTG